MRPVIKYETTSSSSPHVVTSTAEAAQGCQKRQETTTQPPEPGRPPSVDSGVNVEGVVSQDSVFVDDIEPEAAVRSAEEDEPEQEHPGAQQVDVLERNAGQASADLGVVALPEVYSQIIVYELATVHLADSLSKGEEWSPPVDAWLLLPEGRLVVCLIGSKDKRTDVFHVDAFGEQGSMGNTRQHFTKDGGFMKPGAVMTVDVPGVGRRMVIKDVEGLHFFDFQATGARHVFSIKGMRPGCKAVARLYGLAVVPKNPGVSDGCFEVVTICVHCYNFLFVDPKSGFVSRHVPLDPKFRHAVMRLNETKMEVKTGGGTVVKKLYSMLRFMCVDTSGASGIPVRLAVVDLGLNKVFVFDLEGKLQLSFGSTGSGPGQFHDAAGIVCLSDGRFIVADSKNHRFQLFDNGGNFLEFFLPPERIKRPSGLYLIQEGEEEALLICNLPGSVRLFKMVY